MASNDFMKLKTSGDVKAQFRHSEKESRKKQNHSNQDINKNMTDLNVSFEMLDYDDLCDKYDKRIEYLDSLPNQNKRKDRVTCFGVETPCPEELPEHLEDAWCKRVYEIERDMFGSDNVIDGIVHRDEKHEYRHAETGKECVSRTHLHTFVVPEVDGKLNGKAFSSKQRMIQLNNAIQKMSQTEFGVDFLTGEGKKSTKSVEQLKNQSLKKEIEAVKQKEQFLEARSKRQLERGMELEDREIAISHKEKELDKKASELQERDLRLKAKENYLNTSENALNGLRKRLKDKEDELQAREAEIALNGKLDARLKVLEDYVREHPSKVNFASAVNQVKQVMQTGNQALAKERELSQQPDMAGNLSV